MRERLGGIVGGNISATNPNNAFLLKLEEFLQNLKGNKKMDLRISRSLSVIWKMQSQFGLLEVRKPPRCPGLVDRVGTAALNSRDVCGL